MKWAYNKICVDAGHQHGGTDPGAVNGALQEKVLNLDIALKLKHLLEVNGYTVFMPRETDVFSKPIDRAKYANTMGADLFISIHCNSYKLETAHGTETLYYPDDAKSERLAELIQTRLVRHLGLTDRGIKDRKDLTVLNSTKMPAVLVESAFLSNPKEKDLLMNNGFRSHIAQAIFEGINAYNGVTDEMAETVIKQPVDAKKQAVKEGYNFSDETMEYLSNYRFGEALIDRLYQKIKGA